jgi:two-component system cell cycle sensor histidine kinase/response regulator CckA
VRAKYGRAEEALRQSEGRLRTLLEHVDLLAMILDTSGRILYCNEALLRLAGRTAEDTIGASWFELFVPAETQTAVRKVFNDAMQTGNIPGRYANELVLRDGGRRLIQFSNVVLRDAAGVVSGTASIGVDVTERKRSEDALKRLNERLTLATQAASLGIWDWDVATNALIWDAGMCQLHGLEGNHFSGTYDTWLKRLHIEDVDRCENETAQALRGEKDYDTEFRVVWPDGTIRHLKALGQVVRDADRKPLRMIGVTYDVTERKVAEDARQESEQRVRLLLNSTAEAIYGLDVDGKCTFTNLSCLKMFGYANSDDLLGRNMHAVVHHSHADGSPLPVEGCEIFQAFRRGEEAHVDDEVLWRADGTCFSAEYWSYPIRKDGRVVGAVVTVLDIAARRTAEQALRTSESRYRALFDENPMPMWAYDARTLKIVTANQAAAEQYGFTTSELVSMTLTDVQAPEEADKVWEAVKATPLGRQYVGTWKHRRKDGRLLDVDVHLNDVEFEGHPLRLAVLHDVTEQRRLEEQFRQAQRMEAIGRLAGGVAHDFNNLLTVIGGYGELLLADLPTGTPAREAVGEMVAAGVRASALTRQLLAFSRKQVLEPRVLDLNSIVANVDKMLRRLIGEDIDFITVFGPDLGRVRADPGQIEQVLMNLAVNARDAMPKGGKLTIETCNVDLDAAYARQHVNVRPGPYVMLAVSDTGTGMDEATIARIFEPFFTTKEQGKGTGLGLSTVYGIVQQSGGTISVDSIPGRGTSFKIYLPRTEYQSEPERIGMPSGQFVVSGRETVLLIEDEPAVRRLARDILAGKGYTVLEGTDTEEALRLAREHPGPIHLIVTDVVMPGMSGPDLITHARALLPSVKVLFMSGYSDEAVTHHGILEQGAAFLAKPFTAASLLNKVIEVLNR